MTMQPQEPRDVDGVIDTGLTTESGNGV